MEQINLKAQIREDKGKEKVKKMRREGQVPGVVYHRGDKAVEISVPAKELGKILHGVGGENVLINLSIEGEKKKARAVLVKEVQHDPVRRDILHVDFNEISLTEKIIVEVEVVAKGEPIGVKQEGGLLDHALRMVKVQCLPTDIPPHIDVDVSGLHLNGAIHVSDVAIDEKIKILNDPSTLLFQVKLPAAAEEAPAEAGATPEVEVIREKKEEEGKPGEKAKEEPAKEAKAEKK